MAAMKAGRLLRAASAVSAALGRPSLLASPRLPGSWAAISAAAVEAPQGAVQSSDMFAFLGTFGLPTAVVVAATTGFFVIGQQLGEMRAKVAASSKSISDAKSDAAVVAKANQDAASAAIAASKEAASAAIAASKEAAGVAIAATEAKLAANKEVANAAIAASKEAAITAIAATEAKLAANKEVAASAIAATEAKLAANKEVANAAIAATEAKLAAAEKVIAVMMAGVSVAAELATLKALKGEPKRESP